MGMKVNGTSGLTFPDTTTLASAGQASVQAWVNFNGTGTVAIRAAYNVASITDNQVGDYTVNFTTALQDANYSAQQSAGNTTTAVLFAFGYTGAAPSATEYRFFTTTYAGSRTDISHVAVTIFR